MQGGAIRQARQSRVHRLRAISDSHRHEEFVLELNKLIKPADTGNADSVTKDQYEDFAVRVGENEQLRNALKQAKQENISVFLWLLTSRVIDEDIYLCHGDTDSEIIKFLLG